MKEDHELSGDLASMKLFAALLIKQGFEIVAYGHRGDGFDMKATDKNGNVCLFNLKQRYIASNCYGDLVMDKSNYDTLLWAQSNNPDSKVAYVQFFTDNVIYISNEKGWNTIVKQCPKTTRFNDRHYMTKTLVQKMQSDSGVNKIDLNNVDLNVLKDIWS